MSLDTRGQRQLSGGALGDTFYPLFQWLFNEDGDFVRNVEKKLAQARMADNVEMFLARALAIGVISGLALWLVGTLIGYLGVTFLLGGTGAEAPTFIGIPLPEGVSAALDVIKIPALILVTGLVFGVIGFGIGFGSLVSIPYFRANAREREVNVLLSDSISFMYALSVGGLNQLEILQAMAKADDTYGECAKEFQSIVLETEYFDTDYRTAIRNQALETPSDELSQFLTDMLSIINSGGDMTSFLEDQKDKHMRTAKQEQQKMLDTLELFGEMYMTLSLFPLLLIIILVIMSMMGDAQNRLLYGTVYGLIPLTGAGFLVLVSTVTRDEVGDGYLRPDGKDDDFVVDDGLGFLNLGLVENYTGQYTIFDRIKSREGTYEFMQVLKRPDLFFRDHPLFVLGVTVPVTIVALLLVVVFDLAPMSLDGMIARPVLGTFFWVYVPLYINLLPLAIFYEWNVRSRKTIIGSLSENLRKLASANDTGMTLLESVQVVSTTSGGKLSEEFEIMHAKVNYGTSLKDALREFNNKYHVPRLARTVKLISEAQEASSQIQNVLSTAAQASENQDDIDRERIARTRMQVVIILMTYLTLLGVMALLKTQFLDVMAGLSESAAGAGGSGATGQSFGGNVDTDLLSLLFFHAVTLQALLSSFIAGYIRDVNIISGVKFAVILPTIALITWIAVG
ncbi:MULTISPECIES: type II secretion system F family protein [Halomicrobium]|uniref:Type II secretion system protein n=2 Tax=Halomicrobium mukohataei TaxID=57705 RepID=C7NWQ0_HALMD|nr:MULTISPECIES: type II secretion system F family protein [Halomicrobium]ACV48260.1 type II secretion system protein [Halomicrobium mukohataei DSM 12286]QCD66679.1 flagella assembly protein j [Halomicrobium mukohataei]QFR21485.1 flagella assembly protein j [Halomicrobium sp. ZPS1]